ncbi:MAG: hypothetical protein A4E66_02501 [Syntrophus sp. PtaB.Bin001]|nr:MAG: hypothetical protein A4E66_02501 [Syntrophus sp. PtaB.Bin001]
MNRNLADLDHGVEFGGNGIAVLNAERRIDPAGDAEIGMNALSAAKPLDYLLAVAPEMNGLDG